METNTIQESNRLIAEFMGWEKGENYSEEYPFYEAWDEIIDQYVPADMKFNISWDWLMPVVEKIEHLKGCHVIITTSLLCEIFHFGKLVNNRSGDTKIESVYNAVVDFVKYYK